MAYRAKCHLTVAEVRRLTVHVRFLADLPAHKAAVDAMLAAEGVTLQDVADSLRALDGVALLATKRALLTYFDDAAIDTAPDSEIQPLSKAEKLHLKDNYTALLAITAMPAALKKALQEAVVALAGGRSNWRMWYFAVDVVVDRAAKAGAKEQRAFVAAIEQLKEQYGVA